MQPSQPSLSIASASHPWVLFALWFALVTVGCQGELKPEEPDGAYLLFRQALLDQDTDTIYSFLNNKTKTVFDTRTVVLRDMSTKIDRFLPQVDQKLARSQTGVVLLKKHGIKDGKALFKHLFQSKAIEVTEGLQVGSGIRFPGGVEYLDEDKTQAVVVTWANDQYYLVLEEEGEDKKIWRVASWLEDAEAKTQWIVTNQKNLDQTIQDLISEEKEEIDTVIKYLLAQEQKRASRGDRN